MLVDTRRKNDSIAMLFLMNIPASLFQAHPVRRCRLLDMILFDIWISYGNDDTVDYLMELKHQGDSSIFEMLACWNVSRTPSKRCFWCSRVAVTWMLPKGTKNYGMRCLEVRYTQSTTIPSIFCWTGKGISKAIDSLWSQCILSRWKISSPLLPFTSQNQKTWILFSRRCVMWLVCMASLSLLIASKNP